MKNQLLLLLCILLIGSCNRKPKAKNPPLAPTEIITDTVVANEIPKANNSLNYLGMYKGKLPCADCRGIETSLALSEDFNYSLVTKHLGKNVPPTEQTGTYSWNKDETAIILDNIKGSPNQYLVGEKTLTLLDMDGKPIAGKTAASYILRKMTEAEGEKSDVKPVTSEPKKQLAK
jgi:copper homeostasis protein (lipoprotein)